MTSEEIRRGNIIAAARLMRNIEENDPSARDAVKALLPHTGQAHIIGVTGPPGAGKSTLLDRLIAAFRQREQTVGVVVVDPTSPFTGGALLGDRLRMQRHAADKGVFIRSLATRGSLGGLTLSTYDIVTVMDAMGKAVILIETVGTGQDEVEIADLAHTNIVVTIPGLGDGIQAIKAGILESGHIFAVNKADMPESDIAVRQMEAMLDMRHYAEDAWKPPVVATSPLRNEGIDTLMARIDQHRDYLRTHSGEDVRQRQLENRFRRLLKERLFEEAALLLEQRNRWNGFLEDLKQRRTTVNDAVEAAVGEILNQKADRS